MAAVTNPNNTNNVEMGDDQFSHNSHNGHHKGPDSHIETDKYSGGQRVNRWITPGGHPADSSQPAFPIFHRKFANPAPLGLLGFGATTFILSLYNVQARHITHPNVVLGSALGYGGLAQLIAGIEEWACGNTFGATAFSSYGGFWLSFACLYIPQFNIAESYTTTAEFENAVGLFLAIWGIVTFIFFLASMKSSIALCGLFACLDITFWLLTAGFLAPSPNTIKAGGGMGILTAAIAMYIALAGMLTPDTSHFTIPVGDLSRGK